MKQKQQIFMGTTEIAPEKTAAEITSLLVAAKARQISLDYDESGTLCGLRFLLVIEQTPMPFKLPVRTEPVFKLINGRRDVWGAYGQSSMREKDRAQAERVAWRQLLRWIQAQLAMIETGMVKTEEIFLPYLQEKNGRTVYEVFAETRFKALPAPEVA